MALFPDLFVITDPGQLPKGDVDDEDVLTIANLMIRLNILDVLGVVANMAPATQRAMLAKGTLKILGQGHIPVGIGSACMQPDDDGIDYRYSVGYLARRDEVRNGNRLILKTLREAKPKGVVFLLISGLTDAAYILRKHRDLFVNRVRRVVIMGGVVAEGDMPKLDADGRIVPDNANNHTFDMEAAKYFYREVQDEGIGMTILTRHAAGACKVPRAIYDDMAATGHPVGIRLRDTQKFAIEHLWQRACAAPDDKATRKGLPPDRDRAWFSKAFLGGEGMDRHTQDSIWDLVKTFMLYDPATLVAAIPNLREHYYAPHIVERNGAEHMIIGVSPTYHNVRNGAELSEFMHTALVESLRESTTVLQRIRRAA
jgi:inosine-uridine nucleoside N-ribohydrolase